MARHYDDEFTYEPWRHGGWYVNEVWYPSGAVGCVSRNYPDGKWRIACDPRPFESAPTFGSRLEAARAEQALADSLWMVSADCYCAVALAEDGSIDPSIVVPCYQHSNAHVRDLTEAAVA